MQGGGFLLAAIPPWILALLHDLTGSFTLGWALHLAAVLAVCALALRLSPASYRGALHRPGPQHSGGAPAE